MVMMAEGPVENQEEVSRCIPSGIPADVEPPPVRSRGVERSKCKPAWHEAMKVELDGHKMIGAYEAANPPRCGTTAGPREDNEPIEATRRTARPWVAEMAVGT